MLRQIKALYGLRQAAREWNGNLHKLVVSTGSEQRRADPALYFLEEQGAFILLLIYVNDILIFSNFLEKEDGNDKNVC